MSWGLGRHWGFLTGDLKDGVTWNFDQDQTWFGWESQSQGLGGRWGLLIGDLEDVVTFDIIDHVDWWLGRYSESLMKIQHDLVRKSYSPVGCRCGAPLHCCVRVPRSEQKPLNDAELQGQLMLIQYLISLKHFQWIQHFLVLFYDMIISTLIIPLWLLLCITFQ